MLRPEPTLGRDDEQLIVGELADGEVQDLPVELKDLPIEEQALAIKSESVEQMAFKKDLANLQNFKPLDHKLSKQSQ